jgi:hypothetical protein
MSQEAGSGVKVYFAADDGEATEPTILLNNLKSIDEFGGEVEQIDRVYLGSTSVKKRPSQVVDNGDFSFAFDIDFTDALHNALRVVGTFRNIRVEFASATEFEFRAYVSNSTLDSFENNAEVMANITMAISGEITTTG